MADKTASVKVTADPKGFISAMKQVEKAGVQAGDKVGTSLKQAAKKAAKDFVETAKTVMKIGDGGGAGLAKIKEAAKSVKDAYKEAYREAQKLEALRIEVHKKAATAAAASRKETVGALKQGAGMALGAAVGIGGKAVVDANAVLEKATRLSIASRGAGQSGVDPQALMREFFAITQDIKGVTAEQLADGAAKFVQMTGDLGTARSSLRDFATVAQASGASVEDVAGTAAAISQQFGITDPGQIREALSSLVFGGKAGAFELKDAASLFPRLAAAGASFGLDKGVGGVKTLGGLAQIARSGTGSGEQAATAVESLLTRLKTEATKLEGQGVKVYDKGKVRDLPDILVESIAKLGGTDIKRKNALLSQTFGEQGVRAINPLVTQYQDAFAAAKGATEQERQAEAMRLLREKIMESINAAGDWSEVQKDAAAASSSSTAKLTASWEGFTSQISEKVLPKVAALGDKALKAGGSFDMLVSALGFIVDSIAFVSDQFMFLGKMFASDDTKKAVELKGQYESDIMQRDKARADLAAIQFHDQREVDALQKSDPEKFAQLRARAQALQAQAEGADARAQATWKEFSQTEMGKKAVADSASRPPVKVEMPDKEMRVRITNPKEVGGSSGAPAPGWTPPRG
jgi:hypothetical protein